MRSALWLGWIWLCLSTPALAAGEISRFGFDPVRAAQGSLTFTWEVQLHPIVSVGGSQGTLENVSLNRTYARHYFTLRENRFFWDVGPSYSRNLQTQALAKGASSSLGFQWRWRRWNQDLGVCLWQMKPELGGALEQRWEINSSLGIDF